MESFRNKITKTVRGVSGLFIGPSAKQVQAGDEPELSIDSSKRTRDERSVERDDDKDSIFSDDPLYMGSDTQKDECDSEDRRVKKRRLEDGEYESSQVLYDSSTGQPSTHKLKFHSISMGHGDPEGVAVTPEEREYATTKLSTHETEVECPPPNQQQAQTRRMRVARSDGTSQPTHPRHSESTSHYFEPPNSPSHQERYHERQPVSPGHHSRTESSSSDADQAIEYLRNALETQQQQNEELNNTLHQWRGHIHQLESSLQSQIADALSRERAKFEAAFQRAVHEGAQRAEEQQRRAEHYKAELAKTKALLATRTEELSIAQAYMTTADTVSIADVVRAVEKLNGEIYQIAAMLSELVFDHKDGMGDASQHGLVDDSPERRDECEKGRASLVKKVGDDLLRHMEAAGDDTMLFEALVMHFLVMYCCGVVRRFINSDPPANAGLKRVWEGVQKSTEPSIARNWIALTNKQLKTDNTPSHHHIKTDLYLLLLNTGWRPLKSTPSSSSSAKGMTVERFSDTLSDRLSEVTTNALRIRDMVREEVLSCEVDVLVSTKDRVFHPNTMEDAFAVESRGAGRRQQQAQAQEQERQQRVVGTTALGVKCVYPKKGPEDGKPKVDVVLKAKVMLYAALEEAEREREAERRQREEVAERAQADKRWALEERLLAEKREAELRAEDGVPMHGDEQVSSLREARMSDSMQSVESSSQKVEVYDVDAMMCS